MIKNEDTYCTVQHKIVRELGAWEAVVYGTIANLLRKTDGIGEISNQTIMDLCGIGNKMSLFRYINKLIDCGYIEKREGKGRGNISIYYITKKGNNLLPISEKKGNKNDTEKVTKMSEKGNNMLPLNKGINKELNKESGGVLRDAQSPTLSITTPQNFENMEDFNEFWNLYPEAKNYPQEKESCEKVWSLMQKEWREKLVQQLRDGKRWRPAYGNDRDNPVWYLRNYAGQDVETELPFMRPGTVKFEKWCNETWKAGKKIALIRYAGSLAYCQMEDLQQMQNAGAEFLSEFEEFND